MLSPPAKITAAWLNGLSEDDRVVFLRSGWATKMHRWAGDHVCYVMWNRRSLLGTLATNSASIFFLDFGDSVYAVTAAHVYDGFLQAKAKSGRHIVSQIGNLKFDLEERFLSRGPTDEIDIATFRITRDEIIRTGKQAVLASPWPAPVPSAGQAVFILGFTGASRFWIDRRPIGFGSYSVMVPITEIDKTRVCCAFQREYWVPSEGNKSADAQSLGGLSGGPLLLPLEREGSWHLSLAGVISQGVFNEMIYATPAHFIGSDGTVGSTNRCPA